MGGAGAVVEAVGDGVELFLRVDGEISTLGQVLPEQAVGVFAGAALPRAVRIAELDSHAGGSGQLDMPAHLLALIAGQRLAQRLGDRRPNSNRVSATGPLVPWLCRSGYNFLLR